MAVLRPLFPNQTWNGLSKRRISRLDDYPPDYGDWDRILAELIALQNYVLALYQINQPSEPIGTTRFLREDDTWAVPSESGVGSGTVTSVALTAPDDFSVTGSPVTINGTLSITRTTQSNHAFLAGPLTGSATPTYRLIDSTDIPNLPASIITTGVFPTARLPIMSSSGSNHSPGLTPDTPASSGTTKFLREDATWSIPPDTNSGGTVTSIDISVPNEYDISNSPITTNGTISITKKVQSSNTIYAGPSTGTATAPSFRNLVSADIPDLSASIITTGVFSTARLPLMVASGSSHAPGLTPDTPASSGTTKFLREDATWAVPADANSGGTVTSIDISLPSDFSVTGNPITTSGTLSITRTTQSSHTFLAGPTSGSATPTYRLIASSDIPNLDAAIISTGTMSTSRLPLMVASGSSHAPGLTPDTPTSAGTTKFLREDATWAVPPDVSGVSSVDMSVPNEFDISGNPITTSGTITITKKTQTANTVYAGPSTGTATAPTFRNLVSADIPNITESQVTNLTTDLSAKANDSAVVHLATTETLTGSKIFSPSSTAVPIIAQANGTDIIQWKDSGGTVRSSVDQNGYAFIRPFTFALSIGTNITTGTDVSNWLVVNRNGKLVKWSICAKTAPTGSSIIVDVLKSGDNGATFTSLWATNTTNRPTLTATNKTNSGTSFDTTVITEGDILRVDVIQVGSTIAGQSVTVQLLSLMRNL